ncbi:cytochrome P450 4B1-like [Protopterus annectens]|uniref:cytochrome P450 4B1-like n=1 Tax=Protopterus annectens TaxID=7888 RepID=UPI001CF9DA24|nr:cytochrome P450 4B1-like [Protopterus annectens]
MTESLDVYPNVSLMSLDSIVKYAFSWNSNCQIESENSYIKAVYDLSYLTNLRFRCFPYHSDLIFHLSPHGFRFQKACKVAHDHTDRVIQHRKEILKDEKELKKIQQKRHLDFLDILLCARDEKGKGLSDTDLCAEGDTFMFEGHDTTSNGISWILYCLAAYPEHQTKCREEILEVLVGRNTVEWSSPAPGELCYLHTFNLRVFVEHRNKLIPKELFSLSFDKAKSECSKEKPKKTALTSPSTSSVFSRSLEKSMNRTSSDLIVLLEYMKKKQKSWDPVLSSASSKFNYKPLDPLASLNQKSLTSKNLSDLKISDQIAILPILRRIRLIVDYTDFEESLVKLTKDFEHRGYDSTEVHKTSEAIRKLYVFVLRVFDPFSPERSAKRHPHAFIPFAAGGRNCIGQQFAVNEMKVATALTLVRFELAPDLAKPPIKIPQLVLRSKNGIHLKLKKVIHTVKA